MRARVLASVARRSRAQGGFQSYFEILGVANNSPCISCTLLVTDEQARHLGSPRAGSRQSKRDCQLEEGTSVPQTPSILTVKNGKSQPKHWLAGLEPSAPLPLLPLSLFPSHCSQPRLRRSIQQTALVCSDASRSLISSRLVYGETPPSTRLEGSRPISEPSRIQTGARSASQPES